MYYVVDVHFFSFNPYDYAVHGTGYSVFDLDNAKNLAFQIGTCKDVTKVTIINGVTGEIVREIENGKITYDEKEG